MCYEKLIRCYFFHSQFSISVGYNSAKSNIWMFKTGKDVEKKITLKRKSLSVGKIDD